VRGMGTKLTCNRPASTPWARHQHDLEERDAVGARNQAPSLE
jgi:hypothetical protein